jgi:hypothetical protein
MRNRAKCKLCSSIIESYHRYDEVSCKCGEINISGGNYALECGAKDWSNFMRVDDMGNEIFVKVQMDDKTVEHEYKQSKADLHKILQGMIDSIEGMPTNAKTIPLTHYDMQYLLLLMLSHVKIEEGPATSE